MRDIAERVGLSRQLVSIVLRGAPGASEASRERVLAAAREIGYYPDDSARMLRRRRSSQIGVLFNMRQPFEVDLAEALYQHAGNLGYSLTISTVGPSRTQEDALGALMRQRIEALIALDAHEGSERLDKLPAGIPTLLLGGPVSPDPHDNIGIENQAGIDLAVTHLATLGHKHIVYVGPKYGPNAVDRLEGYRISMRHLGLPERIETGAHTEAGGHDAAVRILRARSASPDSSPTALVCVNDHCAIGALQTFVRAGVRVPEDISIVGFDDSSAAALPFVQLTSVRPDLDQMAQRAIESVHTRLESPGASPTTSLISPTLSVRASTAPPSG